MPKSFSLHRQASCNLFSLANQSISTHKKPTGMDKNLAPVSTTTTLQLEPRPLKQLQTLPVWITVPGWNQCQCQCTQQCPRESVSVWRQHYEIGTQTKKRTYLQDVKNISTETWELSSSKNILCSKGTQFSINRPENKEIDKSARK